MARVGRRGERFLYRTGNPVGSVGKTDLTSAHCVGGFAERARDVTKDKVTRDKATGAARRGAVPIFGGRGGMADAGDLKSLDFGREGSSPSAPTFIFSEEKGAAMIKWPITYTDYNGEEHTEDFYFNLNKAEVMEMNLEANGAYAEYLQRIVDQRDGRKLGAEFKRIILKSYGEKSDDGRRFVKSKELAEAFEQTDAYSELYMQLMSDREAIEKFISGVMPKIDNDANPSLENHMTIV